MFQKDAWEGCSSTSSYNIYEKLEKILLRIVVRVVEAVLAAEKEEEGKKKKKVMSGCDFRLQSLSASPFLILVMSG